MRLFEQSCWVIIIMKFVSYTETASSLFPLHEQWVVPFNGMWRLVVLPGQVLEAVNFKGTVNHRCHHIRFPPMLITVHRRLHPLFHLHHIARPHQCPLKCASVVQYRCQQFVMESLLQSTDGCSIETKNDEMIAVHDIRIRPKH
uniref:Homeobox domain-containing protein n=1 Tax=Parascaris univalens TaxID=6257 RepID=A0A915C2P6_PARUN